MIPCKHYRKSKDKKYDFFCKHYNAPLCGNCSGCIHYEVKDESGKHNFCPNCGAQMIGGE